MHKIVIYIILVISIQTAYSQKLGAYAFVRTPHLVDYHFDTSNGTYSQLISTGVGFFHQSKFLELATFISDGNSYGYYTFFGSTIKSSNIGGELNLNTNLFGEVTFLPTQDEQSNTIWIQTTGVCFFPNMQFEKINIGIPICLGLAHSQGNLNLNTRFILNLSVSFNN